MFEGASDRTAWLTADGSLDRHGYDPAPDALEAERVMKRRQRFSVSELARWLRSGAIDEERLQ